MPEMAKTLELMKYTEIKKIYKELESLEIEDKQNVLLSMNCDDSSIFNDFEIEDYRFIKMDEIDTIQQEELISDEYILGCFNAWFLADIIGIDTDVIEAMQKAEAFEAIGKLVISLNKVEELQEAYCSADGYGHHFAHYDHEQHKVGNYYVFKIN